LEQIGLADNDQSCETLFILINKTNMNVNDLFLPIITNNFKLLKIINPISLFYWLLYCSFSTKNNSLSTYADAASGNSKDQNKK
jgi:hypothetical protein